MGIPSYFSYIIKNHSNIIRNHYYYKKICPTHFHSLYMDCNSIIYDTFHALTKTGEYNTTEKMEAAIIHGIIAKIREHVNAIGPSNVVYIAFDGVAPFAKMSQQRTRRYKTAFQNSIDFTKDVILDVGSGPSIPKVLESDGAIHCVENQWNTVSITPGTPFMEKMSKIITREFQENKIVAKTVVISTS
jgi:5'-3' exoribonuclease 1